MRHLISLFLSCSLYAATVDGLKIHSSETGKGPKTVILVHGWTCDETTWTEQVPVLAKQYRVITLDLPGHGQSDSPKDGKFSMELFARAVDAVRAEAKADWVVLVGHSMGTPVVVQYTQLYPQHTAALVFVDGLAGDFNANGRGAQLPANPGATMAGPDGRKNRETMIRGMFSASTTPEIQTKILKMMLSAPEATAAGAMNATFSTMTQTLGIMNTPVLGVYADHSQLASRAYREAHFPHLDFTQIPGTGHFLMLEKPEEFNRLLLAFLARQQY